MKNNVDISKIARNIVFKHKIWVSTYAVVRVCSHKQLHVTASKGFIVSHLYYLSVKMLTYQYLGPCFIFFKQFVIEHNYDAML
jgi:hypothetical protein